MKAPLLSCLALTGLFTLSVLLAGAVAGVWYLVRIRPYWDWPTLTISVLSLTLLTVVALLRWPLAERS